MDSGGIWVICPKIKYWIQPFLNNIPQSVVKELTNIRALDNTKVALTAEWAHRSNWF